jgi:HK97 family phage portal protein
MASPIARAARALSRQVQAWWAAPMVRSMEEPYDQPETKAAIDVTPEVALTLAAYYAAINVISTDVAMLPLKVYRRRRSGGRDEVRDDPRSELLGLSPDGETTAMRWRQAWAGHALGWGNGYAEIGFDGNGMPAGLYLMSPRGTKPQRRPQDGKLYYKHGSGTLPPYRVLHLAGLGFDGLIGYSPVKLAKEALGLGLAAERFGAAFFGNGSVPKGLLKTPGKLDEDAQKRLRESWESVHRSTTNANKVAILEQGLEWQQTTIPPEDAQFLATRQFQVLEVARLFRLPPHKLGDYSQSHLSNIESANLDYLTTTIAPWCEAIEQELNRKLFTPEERAAGMFVEHDMRAFLRGDMKARAEFYTKLRDLGAINPDEIRALENMNPIDGGDLYLVPLNMVSLKEAGKPPEPPPAPAPADPAIDPEPTPDPAAPGGDNNA